MEDRALFDCFDASGALVARVAREGEDEDFDPLRETAPVVPAQPGERAFIVWNTNHNDTRPEMSDILVQELAVVAWRVVAGRGAEPVLAERPYFAGLTFLRTPSGRFRCDAAGEEYANLDELCASALGVWDRKHAKCAPKSRRVSPHTRGVAVH